MARRRTPEEELAATLPDTGIVGEIDAINDGTMPGYQAQHPVALAHAQTLAARGVRPTKPKLVAPDPTRLAMAQRQLALSQADREAAMRANPVGRDYLDPNTFTPVNGAVQSAPPVSRAPKPERKFHEQMQQNKRDAANIEPVPVQNLDLELVNLDPESSHRVMRANLNPGQIADVGGVYYRVGQRSSVPVVFQESPDGGSWIDREQWIEMYRSKNPNLSNEWDKLEKKAKAVRDWQGLTNEQRAELLAPIEVEKQRVAQAAVNGAIPEKTLQQQAQESMIEIDGVKGFYDGTKFTPIKQDKPEKQEKPLTITEVDKLVPPDPKWTDDVIVDAEGNEKNNPNYGQEPLDSIAKRARRAREVQAAINNDLTIHHAPPKFDQPQSAATDADLTPEEISQVDWRQVYKDLIASGMSPQEANREIAAMTGTTREP